VRWTAAAEMSFRFAAARLAAARCSPLLSIAGEAAPTTILLGRPAAFVHPRWETPSSSLCGRGFASDAAPEDDEEREIGNEKVRGLVDEVVQLNLLEFSDFTKLLGKKLGMPEDMMSGGGMMMAPGMMAAPAGGAPAAGGAEVAPAAAEEKTSFTLKLDGFDAASKIKVIKEVRAITELGLKEAKELVEGAPCVVKPGITKEEAEELKKKLEDVGGKVSLE